ncbi:hypothetical protein V3W47_07160 [Deinococcus sp. YIM 134068]|uniref:hypothetical protein n=1 Tax=Deinococcus lichenicola TaxID=3118910 RepID=UPI002F932911
MTDRVPSALKALGIGAPPVASLEREGAFFALLEDTLIYQDEGGTRRVTLRDLNRIHSDQEGMLRVETPAGTALTASLVGYDPARVQAFFAGVRDATARAKHLPSSPLPGVGGQKTFGSSSPTGAPLKREPSVPPITSTPVPAGTGSESPRAEKGPEKAPDNMPNRVPEKAVQKGPEAKEPEKRAGRDRPTTTQWKPSTPGDLGGETVRVIGPASSVGTVTQASTPAAPAPEPAPSAPPRPTPSRSIPSKSAPPQAAPVTPTPVTARPTPTPAPVPVDVPSPPPPLTPAVNRTRQMLARGGLAGLDTRAEGVLGWVGRLRVLAAVLGVAGLGLAALQFTNGAGLTGLWTLIVGGIGALALLAFAEVTALVVALARAVAVGVGTPAGTDEAGVDPDA